MAIQDPGNDPTVGVCSSCGHKIGARCAICGREFVCGSVSVECPNEGCEERVIGDEYGGDLTGGAVEAPRGSVRSDV